MKWAIYTVASFATALSLQGLAAPAGAQELNLYTSRHYQTDEALYANFTKATGVRINRIEGNGDELLQRIKSEGANSPADVFLTVDAGRLYRAEAAGLFQPVKSEILESAIPSNLRHPDNLWFGFSTRARLIFYDKAQVAAGEVSAYEDLADPKWRGKVCIRESSNVYNQSLLASMISHKGEAAAEAWARGAVENFARKPVKGDTNQLRGIGTGECVLALANSYYYVRLLTQPQEKDKGLAEKIGVVFPNQNGRGTHVNISGAGVLKNAPHRDAAVKFLEYLASAEAQAYFANGNNEYPVVEGVAPSSALQALGSFKADSVNVSVFGEFQPAAQRIFDRAGWL